MSQPWREDFSDKVGAAAKPDSQKTYGEQAADWTKGTADSMASTFQPQGQKSTTQKFGDAFSGDQNHNFGERGFVDKAKDTMGFNNSSSTGGRVDFENTFSGTGTGDNRGFIDKTKDKMSFNKDTSSGYDKSSGWKDSTGFDDATNSRF